MTWAPTDFGTDLVAWYDFTDSTKMTIVSGQCSALTALAGPNLAQATSTLRPAVVTGVWPNSSVRLQFDLDRYLESTALAAGVAQPFTWFIAFHFGIFNPTTNRFVTNNSQFGTVQLFVDKTAWGIHASDEVRPSSLAPRPGAMQVLAVVVNGASSKIRQDGVSENAGNPNTVGYALADKLQIGYSCLMPLEAFLVKGAITDTTADTYLMNKYSGDGAITALTDYVGMTFDDVKGTGTVSIHSNDLIDWTIRTPVTGAQNGIAYDNRRVDGYWYMLAWFDPYENHTNIPVFRSTDYVGWEPIGYVDASAALTNGPYGVVWRATWFKDDDDSVHIFGAYSSHPVSYEDTGFRIYEQHPIAGNFTNWSTPIELTGTGLPNNQIDAVVVKVGSTYHCFVKNENTRYIEWMSSSSMTSGWTMQGTGDWAGFGANREGPCLLKVGSTWHVWYFGSGTNESYHSTAPDISGPWATPTVFSVTNHPTRPWGNIWVNPLYATANGSSAVAGSGAVSATGVRIPQGSSTILGQATFSASGVVQVADPVPSTPWRSPHRSFHAVDGRRSYRRRSP